MFKILGKFGYLYGTEPLTSVANGQIKWEANELRFHTPAEHIIKGKQYYMEMQIFAADVNHRSLYCQAHKSAISLMFKVDDASVNPFFDFIETAKSGSELKVDLDILLTQISGVLNTVSGYLGTDTMPNCDKTLCWYIVNEPYTITTAQLLFFQTYMPNNRKTFLFSESTATSTYYNTGPFVPASPKNEL